MLLTFTYRGLSYCRSVKTLIRRPYVKNRRLVQTKPSWRHDLLVGLVSGAIVAAATMLGQAALDDDRSSREERLENLRFVRERSSEVKQDRPFRGMDLKEINLAGLQLSAADLTAADLTASDLTGTSLPEATFKDAQISGAYLTQADLNYSNFMFADLQGAFLDRAHLKAAALDNANFQNAHLEDADLSESSLTGTNLFGAQLLRTNLTNVCYDEITVWPEGFTPPPSNPTHCWSKRSTLPQE